MTNDRPLNIQPLSRELKLLGLNDIERVLAASNLFDAEPKRQWAQRFLSKAHNHLFIAYVDGEAAGFISGVEIDHPDKETEMLIYELGVDEAFRRRGLGRALIHALRDRALERGCRGMWVPIEPDNEAALATYRASGAQSVEPATIMTWDFIDPSRPAKDTLEESEAEPF